jgi:hypothetical protein
VRLLPLAVPLAVRVLAGETARASAAAEAAGTSLSVLVDDDGDRSTTSFVAFILDR